MMPEWFVPLLVKLSFVWAATGHAVDLASTMFCMGQGRCREGNPALMRFKDPAHFAEAKFATAGGTEIVIYDVWAKDHPKLVIVVNGAIGGAFTAVGIANLHRTANR